MLFNNREDMKICALAIFGLGLVSCGSGQSNSGFDDTNPTGTGGTGPGAGSKTDAGSTPKGDGGVVIGGGDGGGSGGEGGSSDCSDAARLVYVVSQENDLYSFSPATLKFTLIGALKCAASGGASPFSMGVDRTGTAWVVYDNGSLFRVSTKDASCTATTYKAPKSPADFLTFGMGFSSDSPGSSAETLFIADSGQNNATQTSAGLASLSTSALTTATIGPFTGTEAGRPCELTGTGDARLFGFFSGATSTGDATLAEIDKTTGATSNSVTLQGVSVGSAWAYSFWGGDFWFYTASGTTTRSKVTRYKSATDKSISVVVDNVGFRIVGAGVSTCAPTTPPPPA
jgi:hypothetical protein